MDHGWVDSKLDFLRQNLVRVDLPLNKFFFEPIGDVYKYLATGGNDDLQWVVACIAKYLSLQTAPSVKYEWGIKMELEVAGQVRFDGRAPGR